MANNFHHTIEPPNPDDEGYRLSPTGDHESLAQARKRLLPESAPAHELRPIPAEEWEFPQVSMRQLLLLTAFYSVVFAVGSRFSHEVFALYTGVAALVGLALLTIYSNASGWMVVGWWMLFGMYLLLSVIAAIA